VPSSDPDNGPDKIVRDPDIGLTRCFIPSKIIDNPHLLAAYGEGFHSERRDHAASRICRAAVHCFVPEIRIKIGHFEPYRRERDKPA
jgi:hypothetical protein